MNFPYTHFRHCPRCGHAQAPPTSCAFRCDACGFCLYFNAAVAAAVLLADPTGRLLFVRRAKDPARGKLAVPGGFIEYHERAEEGLRRETREEVGVDTGELQFLCTQINHYAYQEVVYPVVDLYFTARLPTGQVPKALDGVADICWLMPDALDPEEVAFASIRAALGVYLQLRTGSSFPRFDPQATKRA